MSVVAREIVAPNDNEATAVVSIPMSAGAVVDIDPTWRFLGWRDESYEGQTIPEAIVDVVERIRNGENLAIYVVRLPQRVDVDVPEES